MVIWCVNVFDVVFLILVKKRMKKLLFIQLCDRDKRDIYYLDDFIEEDFELFK